MAVLTDTPVETSWSGKSNIAIRNLPTDPEYNDGVKHVVSIRTEEADPYWTGEPELNPMVESRCDKPDGAPTLSNYDYTYQGCGEILGMRVIRVESAPLSGMGDAVAIFAQPIARAIDVATKVLPRNMQTNIANCGGCAKRKAKLNEMFPFKANA